MLSVVDENITDAFYANEVIQSQSTYHYKVGSLL
jgi:hypothetical protein